MFVIGITGQFASGKTAVARILSRMCNAAIVDADKIGHEVLSDKDVKKRLVSYFGTAERKALAKKAFSSAKNHKILCEITHPLLVDKIKERLKGGIVIIDAAVLIEMGLLKYVDMLIVVNANRAQQIRRAKAKWKLSEKEILKRIKLQIPASRLFKKADFIIDNNGSLDKTRKQIQNVRYEICQKMTK